MKNIFSILFVALVFASCSSVKSSLDSSVLLKNPWVLQSITGNSVDVSEFAHGLPFLEFSEDGKVSGFDGCNQFNGSVDLTSEGIVFGPLVSTRMACSGVDSDSFTNALNQVTGYKVNGKVLELTGVDGALLSFLPKQ